MRRSVAPASVLGLALLAVGSVGSAVARADAARKRVAVLDVIVDGASADVSSQVELTVVEQLRRQGYEVIPLATTHEAIARHEDLQAGCMFGPCVAPLARILKAEELLDVRMTVEGQSYSLVISMIDGVHGTPIGQVSTSCGVCTVAEALGKTTAAVKALGGQVVEVHTVDDVPIVTMKPARPSRLVPVFLIVSGLVLSGAGAGIVAGTDSPEPGWVGIGSGGTLLVTGLVMLATQD